MCPSPTPSYTSPGRKAATPSPHPVARDPWRSSMLFHLQKNVSLCGPGQGGMWRHPYCFHGLLWTSLLYASGLRYPEDSVSCCVLPDSAAEKERHRSLAKKLSLLSLLHSKSWAMASPKVPPLLAGLIKAVPSPDSVWNYYWRESRVRLGCACRETEPSAYS